MNASFSKAFFLISALLLAAPASGAIGGGIGGLSTNNCRSISDYIIDNWWDLRSYMTSELKASRPRHSDFQCVNPGYTQELSPNMVPGHRNVLQCFGRGSDPKICCDRDLQACVSYSGG